MGKVIEMYPRKKNGNSNQLPNGLLQRFETGLLEAIRSVFRRSDQPKIKKWLKAKQVQIFLGMSEKELNDLVVSEDIYYSKVGNIAYYDADDINRLLLRNKKPAKSTLETFCHHN